MTKDQILLNAELAKRELARRSYEFYLSYTTPGWLPTRFSSFLANQVQSFVTQTTGNAYDILIVETPPQHGKSMTITEALPAWYLGRNPTARVIEASYNEETAERFSRRNKEKIRQFGANLFGHGIGSIDRATEFELDNNQGRMISRGIMSGITGNPANLLVIDDPIKNRVEADSDSYVGLGYWRVDEMQVGCGGFLCREGKPEAVYECTAIYLAEQKGDAYYWHGKKLAPGENEILCLSCADEDGWVCVAVFEYIGEMP